MNYFRRKRVREEIRMALPSFLDLLSLSVAAGDDWVRAIRQIVGILPGSGLLAEWRRFLHVIETGASRSQALEDLCKRNPSPELKVLVGLLLQSVALGTPLAPILLAEARQLRGERLQQIERRGVIASQKLLFPIIFCILPAIFVVIFSPLVIRWLTGGLEGFLQ